MIGQTVSHYKVLEKLGAGGMGEVFLAEDTELGRKAALKFLPHHFDLDPDVRARFKREAQALAALNHPNIVTVFQVAENEGRPYIAMEYVAGQSVKQLVSSGVLELPHILDLAIQIVEGLGSAHRSQIVHRDIKSDNIIVSSDGRVKIMDFGLATWRGVARVTQEGSTVGTMAYMSPEQAQGRQVDARSDLFSLGVVLYELTAGRLPFGGEHDAAVVYSLVHEEPEPMARFAAHAPDAWQRIVSKCLAKSTDERYQSAPDLLADLKSLRRALTSEAAPARAGIKEPSDRPSIAVLPFANMSADPENEYFSDGLSEELLNVLAKLPELRVTGRTSSFAFKGKQDDLRLIGQKLNVSTILEGSVRKTGNRVRITAQLVNVSDGFHLWSETYDRVLDDIFAVQDDIARSVGKALKLTLLGAREARHTHHSEAYRLFLQARYFTLRNTRNDLETAVRLYKQALALDPADARIWAGLAWAYLNQVGYGTASLEKGYLTVKETAAHALSLDSECAEALRITGVSKQIFEYDWAGAQRDLEKALALEPSNAANISSLGFHLGCMGRLDEAVTLLKRGIEIDPLNPATYFNLGRVLYWSGRPEEALQEFQKTLELSPDFVSGQVRLGITYLALNRLDEALAAVQNEQTTGYREYVLAIVYHAMGRKTESDAALKSLEALGDQWAFQLAVVTAYRGDRDAAFDWLEKAREVHDSGLPMTAVMPLLSGLHDDPRWSPFLKKIGLGV